MRTNQIANDSQQSESKAKQQLTAYDNKNGIANIEVPGTAENEEKNNETIFAEGRGRIASRQEAVGTRSQYRSVRSFYNKPAMQAEGTF